jgi:hypothetical protein
MCQRGCSHSAVALMLVHCCTDGALMCGDGCISICILAERAKRMGGSSWVVGDRRARTLYQLELYMRYVPIGEHMISN